MEGLVPNCGLVVKLFNSIPKKILAILKVSVEEFKEHLDKYLQTIKDEPKVDGLSPSACNQYSAAHSNSILDQSRTNRRIGA